MVRTRPVRRENTKARVESCLALDAADLSRTGVLLVGTSGALRWTNTLTGRDLASVGYVMGPDGTLRLHYAVDNRPITCAIPVALTRPHFGGVRRWLSCPMVAAEGERRCGRRVRRLYLRGERFGCRQCHDLRYRSSQEAHLVERHLRRRGYGRDRVLEIAGEYRAAMRKVRPWRRP